MLSVVEAESCKMPLKNYFGERVKWDERKFTEWCSAVVSGLQQGREYGTMTYVGLDYRLAVECQQTCLVIKILLG